VPVRAHSAPLMSARVAASPHHLRLDLQRERRARVSHLSHDVGQRGASLVRGRCTMAEGYSSPTRGRT